LIDKHSLTWQHIVKYANKEKSEAIEMLIADRNSEQQRGIILALDRLLAQAGDDDIVDSDN